MKIKSNENVNTTITLHHTAVSMNKSCNCDHSECKPNCTHWDWDCWFHSVLYVVFGYLTLTLFTWADMNSILLIFLLVLNRYFRIHMIDSIVYFLRLVSGHILFIQYNSIVWKCLRLCVLKEVASNCLAGCAYRLNSAEEHEHDQFNFTHLQGCRIAPDMWERVGGGRGDRCHYLTCT